MRNRIEEQINYPVERVKRRRGMWCEEHSMTYFAIFDK